MTPTVAAIIPAAGSGSRMKLDHPKQYHQLAGTPILIHTIRAFYHHPAIGRTVVVVPAEWLEKTREMLAEHGLSGDTLTVVAGGQRRQDSVMAGLRVLDHDTEVVLVHDGARPLVSADLITRSAKAVHKHGAAIAAVPVKDTLKRGDKTCRITATIDRNNLWQAQTPQGAKLSLLFSAFETAGEMDVTDEAMLLEHAGIPVMLVEGEETNLKITRPEDLPLAESIMQQKTAPEFRIGHGFDAHRLVEGRKLVLGGVTIPYERGLAGHSDADVLTHALCDALLGALGAGDIGRHFPDNDASFANIYSILLLDKVMELVSERGFRIGNIDITIICQKPKLASFLLDMKEILAKSCRTDSSAVNLKATTTEKMGYTGRGEGISCHAVVLLVK
ncbi:2-C-methyl-D-erythritol 4-phosphate cytidylyltransferase [Desulfopila aestuarii]|uniref:Bifunctional enzyme IspD/IspF n=1 Tax=Desulfopila aestuarii DSM 18488 TaxID=1121416 RepID=A0A1M7YCQ2_9BACT|nr:2-C-methyl-D-erythritol 4-phosphate cytidylyltransferase [Desulfopila aestuarii]SHO50414.1 2-C-methyl-D-erythritol 2,4-cyclodiphosphate synthase [Desulfopila aestuarii DSM 18488]